jgi:hypothetical protein
MEDSMDEIALARLALLRAWKLRRIAVRHDLIRGMRQCDVAEKYGIARTRVSQLYHQAGRHYGENDWRFQRYVDMRREQAQLLEEYPALYAEITAAPPEPEFWEENE